jgi:hypothetical protein
VASKAYVKRTPGTDRGLSGALRTFAPLRRRTGSRNIRTTWRGFFVDAGRGSMR